MAHTEVVLVKQGPFHHPDSTLISLVHHSDLKHLVTNWTGHLQGEGKTMLCGKLTEKQLN